MGDREEGKKRATSQQGFLGRCGPARHRQTAPPFIRMAKALIGDPDLNIRACNRIYRLRGFGCQCQVVL